ncbi:hypothetical protein EC973_009373 [Apophysomyces ossiformis]|uniref:Uncharacterized protein n=1 Tax=Apophysomyces ossiformis TaxID=679940 RepID=A0A8H7BSF0_9FUNG|nr:hypothetical protein EC973_009373 [Apophysomyces ossiformis]
MSKASLLEQNPTNTSDTSLDHSAGPPAYEEAIHLSQSRSHGVETSGSISQLLPNETDEPSYHQDESTQPLLQVVVDDRSGRAHSSPSNVSAQPMACTANSNNSISEPQRMHEEAIALQKTLQELNTPPRMKIKVRGYHVARFYKSRVTNDSDGNIVIEESNPRTSQVDDFCYEIDCSQYISRECQGIHGQPNTKTGYTQTANEVCAEYVQKKSLLKELHLNKKVEWNYSELTQGKCFPSPSFFQSRILRETGLS